MKLKTIWRDSAIFLGALVALLLAGRWLTQTTINVAVLSGIPAYFLAITVIAVASSIPDFAVGFRAIKSGHQFIGLGDVLGSVIIELVLYFGIIGLFAPRMVDLSTIANALIFLVIGVTFMTLVILRKKTVTWKHGLFLLGVYAVFLIIEIIRVV